MYILKHFDGSVQNCSISIANALEILLYFSKQWILYIKMAVSPLLMHWRYCSLSVSNGFCISKQPHLEFHSERPGDQFYMGQVTELWLSCYLVLLSIDFAINWWQNQVTRQLQFRDLTHREIIFPSIEIPITKIISFYLFNGSSYCVNTSSLYWNVPLIHFLTNQYHWRSGAQSQFTEKLRTVGCHYNPVQ